MTDNHDELPDIDEIRRFLEEAVRSRSLREVAAESGVSRETIRKLVVSEAAVPYGRTLHHLRQWYGRGAAGRAGPGRRRPTRADQQRLEARLDSVQRVFPSDAELAAALGVDRAQPGRWRAGQAPDPHNLERIVALDAVIELLSGYLSPSSIPKWLNGVNAHLGDRRPIAVLRGGSLSEVVAAIEAEKSGAFA